MALTERPEITFSPDRPTPIILGQNAVSPNDPVFFLSPDALGCENWCPSPTPMEGFHERHVGFFWNNKICFNFVSILFEKIKLTVSERTYIIVPMV